tara:strand:- start:600 stop:3971 length:3372 start_codon:yes stop_codon:yes gene_type:complete
MAQFSKTNFRGLLIPDDRLTESNLSAAHSSFSQAGPLPGVPIPQANTDVNLEATGSQSANKQLRIATHRGGHPGKGGATFRFKNESDSASSWRGHWPAHTYSGWDPLDVCDPLTAAGTNAVYQKHAVLMDDDKVGYCYARKITSSFTVYYQIRFHSLDASGTHSAGVTVYSTTDSITQGLHPCLMKLPSGRIVLYYYNENVPGETVQVGSFYSDDHGANWVSASEACLPDSIPVSSAATDYDLDDRPSAKMRAAYSGGQVLLIIGFQSNDTSTGSFQDGFAQYASSDLGNTFDLVEIWDRTVNGVQAEIVPANNGFNVFYVSYNPSGTFLFVGRKILASAYIPLTNASTFLSANVVSTGSWEAGKWGGGRVFTDAEIAACIGDDGILYLIARGRSTGGSMSTNNVGDIRMAMDRSGGSEITGAYEWLGQGTESSLNASGTGGTLYFAETTADFPRDFGLVSGHGRLALFHSWSASTSNRDQSLAVSYMGGYNTVTLGSYQANGDIARLVCWDYEYLPFELPGNFSGWTASTTATFTQAVTSGYLGLTTTNGRVEYQKNVAGTIAEGVIIHFGVQHVSQTGASNKYVRATIGLDDASDVYTTEINIRAGDVVVDDADGGTKGTLSIDCATNGVEVLAFFKSNKVTVFARQMTFAADNAWSTVCSNQTLAGNTGGAGNFVRFGHVASSTASSRWHWFNFTSDEYAGETPFAGGFTNPTNLNGKPYSTMNSTYVDDGVRIRAIDGPTTPGDSWNIDTRYAYGIERTIPFSEPSPSKGWRSNDESEQTIAWTFSGVNRYTELGLYLDGCNWRTANLQAWNGSSWATIAAIDLAAGQTNLAYQQGDISMFVNPSASTAPGRYYEFNELIGGTVRVNPSSGSDFSRKITANGAGQWTQQANYVRANVEMESTPIVIATTGTLDIWSPRILIAVHKLANSYKGLRLVIAASQGTADGHYRIGQMILGPLHLMSQDYSWGRTLATEPNTEVVTYRDGSRSSFKRSENRRSVVFGWGEGIDVTSIQGSAPAPDYLVATSTSGALPIGYRGDLPSTMRQINAYTAGPHIPVVYCANIESGSSGNDTKTMQGLTAALYGRVITGVSEDCIVGDENSGSAGEVMRVNTLTIEEEL